MLEADQELVRAVREGSALAESPLHGDRHWRAVAATALRLAQSTPGADREVLVLFGLFHDARRLNEDYDPDHGARAADLARELAPVGGHQLVRLTDACERHTGGPPDEDPTIGCCFDADRLGLARVGATVDPAYLSTPAAFNETTADWAATLHLNPPPWEDLFAELRKERS